MSELQEPIEVTDRGRRLKLARLSRAEIAEDCAALRHSTLLDEMGWVKNAAATPSQLLDRFDELASAFGIFLDQELIAAARLIPGSSSKDIPSGPFVPEMIDMGEGVAEISKVVVKPLFRNRGFFTTLLLRCRIEAIVQNVCHLIITVVDSPRIRKFLGSHGFDVAGAPFRYEDATIAPRGATILLRAGLQGIDASERERLHDQFHRNWAKISRELVQHAQMLEK